MTNIRLKTTSLRVEKGKTILETRHVEDEIPCKQCKKNPRQRGSSRCEQCAKSFVVMKMEEERLRRKVGQATQIKSNVV